MSGDEGEPSTKLSAEDGVRWAYRLLLGREPELEAIENNPFHDDLPKLLGLMLHSEEFRLRLRSLGQQTQWQQKPTATLGLTELDAIKDLQIREYALNGYRSIPGWGIDDFLIKFFLSLDQYQKENSIRGNLFELGVYYGKVLILLGLMARSDERLVAMDVFETYASHNIDRSGDGVTKEAVLKNLMEFGLTEKTDVIVGDSLFVDFDEHPSLRNLRFAHIDGGHYVDAIVSDLIKAQKIMVPGGIIVVDDWSHNYFTGVNEGCHRFLSFATPRLVIPFAVGWNKLCLTTHSHHAELVEYVRNTLQRPMTKVHDFDVVSIND